MAGGAVVLLLIILAALAPLLARADPDYQFRENGLTQEGLPRARSGEFWLGTDTLGRDIYSRLLYGARVSLLVGVGANLVAIVVGAMIGTLAGYYGGILETLLMRLTDAMLALPVFLFALAVSSVLKPGLGMLIVIIGVFYWAPIARMAYGQVLSIKENDYIVAARSIGATGPRILFRHVAPQLMPILIVYVSLGVASAVMTESVLSYLGVGVRPPMPSWGNMVAEGQRYYRSAPWLSLYPGFCIMLTVLGFNLLGDGLRDALDPRLRGR
jgi:peptide/nickel transport system permease protein